MMGKAKRVKEKERRKGKRRNNRTTQLISASVHACAIFFVHNEE